MVSQNLTFTIITGYALFALIGLKLYTTLFNPLTIFNGVWSISLLLFYLGLTDFPSSLSLNGIFIFSILLLSYNMLYFIYYFKERRRHPSNVSISISNKVIYTMFAIWVILSVFEIYISKGFPFLWKLQGISKTYADFGIPTVHGFLNSLSWVLNLTAFLKIVKSDFKNKAMIFIFISILIYYVLLLARQSLTTTFIQVIFLYYLFRKQDIFKIIMFSLLAVLIFGLMGNFRSGSEHFRQVAGIDSKVSDNLLGFYWIYMYIITPIGNLDNASLIIHKFGLGVNSLLQILPTIIERQFNLPNLNNVDFLVNKSFNVSTFMIEPFLDFSFFGIIITSLPYSILSFKLWNRFIKYPHSELNILSYCIFINILFFSFFVNMLLSLPFLMEFLFLYIFILFSNKKVVF